MTFDEIYESARAKVRRVARNYALPNDVDDLEQDAWVRIWRDSARLDGSVHPNAFAVVSAKRVALDRPHLRRRSRALAALSLDMAENDGARAKPGTVAFAVAEDSCDGQAQADARVRLRDVRRIAHEVLTPQQLAVFRLMETDATLTEISAAMGLEPSTTHGHIKRIRRKLIAAGA